MTAMKRVDSRAFMPGVPENHRCFPERLADHVAGLGADSGKRGLVGIQEIAVLVQQPLILKSVLQDCAHLGFVGFELRRPLGDPQFEDFVQPAQILLRLLGGRDVMGHADEADVASGRVPARLGLGAQPSPFVIGAQVARFQHERLERSLAGD